MNLKTGILAAAAALTLAVPAVASAQPYGGGYGYGYRSAPRYSGDYRRYQAPRDWRRYQAMRRWQWERQRAYRGGYGRSYGYANPYYR